MLNRGNVMINDTIADMLTRLRNAHLANKTSVVLRATRVTRNIAQLLFQEGFLSSVEPEIDGMFEIKHREFSSSLASPEGLILEKVYYPKDTFNNDSIGFVIHPNEV